MMRIGVVKPSADGKMRITEPDWLFADANPETARKMCSYYKNIGEYRRMPANPDDSALISYYDVTDYIPSIDYYLHNKTLATTFVFDECYVDDSPVQSADVWAGVNIYEIDPEKGPQRVFAMTTQKDEDLKVAPVRYPTPTKLEFPSKEVAPEK
ncbi:MAG: hypothetical protein ACOX0A_08815 [Thermoguttaceae bacterium]|jgi:hypothetical protein